MNNLLRWLGLFWGVGVGGAVQAQGVYPLLYASSHCCCCARCYKGNSRDTVATTELSNRLAFFLGPVLLHDSHGTPYGGGDLEVGYAVRPRLTLGGHGTITGHTASVSNYGYEATRPAVALYDLAATARYQVLNARRWRLEVLAGPGLGVATLVDRDRLVPGQGRYANTYHPALVTFAVYPQLEAGVGLTFKLRRDFWLNSDMRYVQQPLAGRFGAPTAFSHWALRVGISAPWGYLRR